MPEWKISHPGAENLTLAVMGCVVNGPGESRHANIGISLPGTGEAPAAPVFVDGEKTVTLRGDNIAREFVAIIDDYVERQLWTRRDQRALTPAEAAEAARAGSALRRGRSCACMAGACCCVFVGLLLPLWGFAALVEDLHEGEAFAFDEPILQFAHGMANARLRPRLPADLGARLRSGAWCRSTSCWCSALALQRRLREGLFAASRARRLGCC